MAEASVLHLEQFDNRYCHSGGTQWWNAPLEGVMRDVACWGTLQAWTTQQVDIGGEVLGGDIVWMFSVHQRPVVLKVVLLGGGGTLWAGAL